MRMRPLAVMTATAGVVAGTVGVAAPAQAIKQQSAWCQITNVLVHDSSLADKHYDSYDRTNNVMGNVILKYQARCPVTVTKKVRVRKKYRNATGKVKWRKITKTRTEQRTVNTTDYVQEYIFEYGPASQWTYDALILKDASYKVGEYTYITVSNSNIAGEYKVWPSLW